MDKSNLNYKTNSTIMQIQNMLEEADELQEKIKNIMSDKDISKTNVFRLKNIKSDLSSLINILQNKNIQELSKLAGLKAANTGLGSYTLEEVGLILGGVTRERVRQIETQAIKKIKHPKIIKNFYNYIK